MLAGLPPEIRFNIYDLTWKNRTHKFSCRGPSLVFIRHMDLSPPKIASVCREMRDYARQKYQIFPLAYRKRDFNLIKLMIGRRILPIAAMHNLILDQLHTNATAKRLPAWFSTSYDSIEVQLGSSSYVGEILREAIDFDESNRLLISMWPTHSGMEHLPSRTIDQPETEFYRLLKTKRDEALILPGDELLAIAFILPG
ncbi:hypothetical protein PG994_001096 [Apiospora phragmitis]|uniref:2EXR domain-containing protein n=1 Tax=Apiospora phragmitis TaxID=2905665 RepID=A0ABR1WSJ5_9PEZI